MSRHLLALPLAAALALSLPACGPDKEKAAPRANPELPSRADQPPNADRPAAGAQMNPDTHDPSIPQNPANKEPGKKDSSPPSGSGEQPVEKVPKAK